MKHAVRHRIVVAEDGIAQLEDEVIEVHRELGTGEGERPSPERGRLRAVGLKVVAEPSTDPSPLRSPAEAGLQGGPLGLVQRVAVELGERPAGFDRHPVRVAATGVEHQPLGRLSSELDQLVLELERAEPLELPLVVAVGHWVSTSASVGAHAVLG